MAYLKNNSPLTEREIYSTYRNEFFAIDTKKYFNHYSYKDDVFMGNISAINNEIQSEYSI